MNRKYKVGQVTKEMISLVEEMNVREFGVLTCYLCKLPVEGRWAIEHKLPVVRGGLSEIGNLGVSHKGCNIKKGSRTPQECLKAGIF